MATEAYRRGDLSGTQLIEVLTGRGGWSSRHDLVELETRLCMAARDHRRSQYRPRREHGAEGVGCAGGRAGAQDARLVAQPDLAGNPARSAPLPVPAHASRSWWTVPAQGWRPRPSDG